MSPAALRAGLTLMLLSTAGSARAESTLLPGFQIGGALTDLPTAPKHLDFRLGAGLDWVHSAGPVLALRVDTSHRVDATFALLAGYWGEGLRAGQGLPLGVTAGGWLGTDVRGDLSAGARGVLAWSLWYGRAVVEADVNMYRRLVPDGHRGSGDWAWTVGLSLRVVPFVPIVL